jgi:hypothetical protein
VAPVFALKRGLAAAPKVSKKCESVINVKATTYLCISLIHL